MILKEAWEQRDKLRAEGDKLIAKGFKLCSEGDKLYAEAVDGFFEPGPSIDWLTGDVKGKPLPIPACELGIK